MIGEHRDFHKGAIYSVCWSPLPKGAKSAIAGLAASCSSDGFWYAASMLLECAALLFHIPSNSYIFNPEDGGVIKKYRHPDEAYGCDWNTLNT